MWRDFLVIFVLIQSSLQQEERPNCRVAFEETICKNIDFNTDADVLKSTTIETPSLVIEASFGTDLNQANFQLNETSKDRINELILINNNFEKIDTNNLCTTFKNLQRLRLINNRGISGVNGGNFKNCANLNELTLDNVIVDGAVLPLLPNLHDLSFNNTKFENGLNLTNLNQLKTLSLQYTNIKDYLNNPELLKQLSKLQILNLEHNQLDSLPINDWSNLEILDLSYNNFDNTIWQQLNQSKSIKVLFLDHNNINDIVDIAKLLTNHPQLERIFLSGRKFIAEKIKQIDDELKNTISDRNLNLIWVDN